MATLRRMFAAVIIGLECSLTALAQSPPTRDAMLDSHVRLVIQPKADPSHPHFGSGVVVYSENGATDIITCRHNIVGMGKFNLTVQDDDGQKNRFRAGKVVESPLFLLDADVAVLRITGAPAAAGAARLAPYGYTPVNPVFSVGSNQGKAPTIWTGNIVELDVEQKNEDGQIVLNNMLISHESQDGRSGGAVYDSKGYLVGITWGSMSPAPHGDGMTRAVNLTKIRWAPLAELQARSGQVVRDQRQVAVAGKPQTSPQRPILRPITSTPAPPAAVAQALPAVAASAPLNDFLVRRSTSDLRILLFHRASDPVDLYRAAIADPNTLFLNAESDEASRQAAAIWGVRSLPAAVAVLPNPDGSFRSVGQLYGAGITLKGLRAIAEGKVVAQ